MINKIILDLCGGTGSWGKPYRDAGYDVRLITLPEYDVRTYNPPENVYGILAAPPCESFSIAPRKEYRKSPIEHGLSILNSCLRIIEKSNPVFWAVENPCGLMRQYMGKPQFTFQPYWFGDGWTKKNGYLG